MSFKEKSMRKQLTVILLTLISAVILVPSARAANEGNVVVDVPHEFVAGGKTLPAGHYTVSRIHSLDPSILVLSSHEQHATVVLSPTSFDDTMTGNVRLTFNRVGEQYFLNTIATLDGAYTFVTPHSTTVLSTEAASSASSSGK
jgi:hypothetical protein